MPYPGRIHASLRSPITSLNAIASQRTIHWFDHPCIHAGGREEYEAANHSKT